MSEFRLVALVVCGAVALTGVALFARVIRQFLAVFRLGQPDGTRTGDKGARTVTLLREFLGHTRMSRLPAVAVAHWFTMISFGVLFFTLLNAFGQLIEADFALPVIGHFFLYEWVTEFFAWTGFVGIVTLMVIRQKNHPRSAAGEGGRRSRFFGSTWWQACYVELTILGVTICIISLRALEYALEKLGGTTGTTAVGHANALHYPLTGWLGAMFKGWSVSRLEDVIVVVAAVKILISFAWMITISLQPTMGVAWHRFLAFFNIFLKRHADGRTSLGELQPLMVGGAPVDFENIEDLDEDAALGVGKVEDFTWKGLLDFSTCTECGRCQSQCPAWNTDKPLSPKLLVMALRDHAHAKAPWLLATHGLQVAMPKDDGIASGFLGGLSEGMAPWITFRGKDKEPTDPHVRGQILGAPLVGDSGYDITNPLAAYNPHGPDAGAERIAIGCPFCRVMMSDGLTAAQSEGKAETSRSSTSRRCSSPPSSKESDIIHDTF